MSSARRRGRPQERRQKKETTASAPIPVPSLRAFGLPVALSLGLVLLTLVPRVDAHTALARSFWGAALALGIWQVALLFRFRRAGAAPTLCVVLRPQHYVQAVVQAAVLVYWGLLLATCL